MNSFGPTRTHLALSVLGQYYFLNPYDKVAVFWPIVILAFSMCRYHTWRPLFKPTLWRIRDSLHLKHSEENHTPHISKINDLAITDTKRYCDDTAYFALSDDVHEAFEKAMCTRFESKLLGQLHWFQWARITQHTNYDITLDQLRYSIVMIKRFQLY